MHRHQTRKDGRTPYAAHPGRVAMIIAIVFGFTDELMRRYIQYPQSISALHVAGQHGIGGLLRLQTHRGRVNERNPHGSILRLVSTSYQR